MTSLFFVDLDRTLIFSKRMVEEGEPLVCVERKHGRPMSFVTPRASELIASLTGRLVPVTTRSREQYDRIELPGAAPPYAIVANGAVVLRDGEPDPSYLPPQGTPLGDIRALVAAVSDRHPGIVRNVRDVAGAFCRVAVHAEGADPFVAELTALAPSSGLVVARQGKKVYCVPRELDKGHAVRWLAGGRAIVAAGDSTLDAGFLEIADHALVPRHGDLAADPRWRTTEATGVRAGEEILGWARACMMET